MFREEALVVGSSACEGIDVPCYLIGDIAIAVDVFGEKGAVIPSSSSHQ
jgi:hypothetical protein